MPERRYRAITLREIQAYRQDLAPYIKAMKELDARRDRGELYDPKVLSRAVREIEDRYITGEFVRALRMSASTPGRVMNQREAAGSIYRSQKSWTSWEGGARTPTLVEVNYFMHVNGLG